MCSTGAVLCARKETIQLQSTGWKPPTDRVPCTKKTNQSKRMKRVLALSAGLFLITVVFTSAEAADAMSKEDAKKAKMAELLKKYDKNGDGKIDDAEEEGIRADRKKEGEAKKAAARAELLKKYDKNGDGRIDDAEEEVIRAERKKAEAGKKAAALADLIKKYDKNGNGKIDDAEEEAIRADRLKQKQQKEAK